MKREAPASIYRKAITHITWTLVSIPVVVWIVPLTLSRLGISMETIIAVFSGPAAVVLLIVGGGGTLLIKCDKCGKSVFARGIFVTPWPEKQCSKCGTDLDPS